VFDSRYEAQVRLLLRCLPEIGRHACFALKGGTAINLFVRDMLRVSVDIDLTYLPLKPRNEALTEISETLLTIGHDIERRIPGSQVHASRMQGHVVKLLVSTSEAVIKIEPNLILRGSIYSPRNMDLCPVAQNHFGAFVSVPTLSIADLYGGKLCAALDRQHPRDFFDVKVLLDDTGTTPEIRRSFVVHLAGHNRPMNELLSPRLLDIRSLYDDQFVGMTQEEVSLQGLREVQEKLAHRIVQSLDDDERAFLLSMKRGEPEWDRLGVDNLDQLPALQWKCLNIKKMSPEKRASELDRLQRVLS
jgi:predicted nucleotidyltransferase component of viral defense system